MFSYCVLMRAKRSRNEGEGGLRRLNLRTSVASLLPPLCDRKLEAEGRALQMSEASLPYQGKRNTGTEAVGRGERSEAETQVRPQAEPESKRAKRVCSLHYVIESSINLYKPRHKDDGMYR